jgi:hypothetical protein
MYQWDEMSVALHLLHALTWLEFQVTGITIKTNTSHSEISLTFIYFTSVFFPSHSKFTGFCRLCFRLRAALLLFFTVFHYTDAQDSHQIMEKVNHIQKRN